MTSWTNCFWFDYLIVFCMGCFLENVAIICIIGKKNVKNFFV